MRNIMVTCMLLSFINMLGAQTIKRLDIYYLPWDIRPEDRLEAADVRNFNQGKNSYFFVEDSAVISEFVKSMSVFYLRPFPELKVMNHVMVIDITFEEGSKKTIGLNTAKCLVFSDVFYYRNLALLKWIDKYVPPAKKPW